MNTVIINVEDRHGRIRKVEACCGDNMMEVLRDQGFGVEGTCGGAVSCGSCHIYVDPSLMTQLTPQIDDEAAMLDAIQTEVTVDPTSRLSCQIVVSDYMNGMRIKVAQEI
ncbi:2Fe-2S iron-sulfur cluster-binding protein [Zhongshania aquimaris]|uniref:2Fe-2S iron-sulfur cluster binding domain-containing protein n=1 Tax=Zhongshania aquimaris TaxID=2857107 RepID=A0ABS6VV24_9GAMM|nr:2Fe-2S iron-sulfur cluster-binding protein [Zhongshania aquimaris]MBW2942184.1 2Fe-2S iron-sulfur cluster binding domain-containing protein [Zhongshania aquimaris]